MKRPGDGISPMDIDKIIGKIIILDLDSDSKLEWEHLE
jgi:sialic acid synthase SpsE